LNLEPVGQQKARSQWMRWRACRNSVGRFLGLLRHDGHSRQHAMGMMMVVAAMVQTNAH
jgi:hypothetical protein